MKKIAVFLLVLFLLASPVFAEEDSLSVIETETGDKYLVEDMQRFSSLQKPVVALALGGGGARAMVNIGVLKALEEEKIPVDIILGTSMGAIVAALYGSGLSLQEIEDILLSGILTSLFDLNFPFHKSLLTTDRLDYTLEALTPEKNFEDFPIPTALLSYDLTKGMRYIHTTGRVAEVVHGSYALPLFFPVKEYQGSYFMDTGILELTPAQAARLLGADIIISTTAYNKLPYNTYGLFYQSIFRFVDLIKEENSRKIVEKYSDIVIDHDVGDYSMMDYNLTEWFVEYGYRRAREEMDNIKNLIQQQGVQYSLQDRERDNDYIYDVMNDIRNDRFVMEPLNIKPFFNYGQDMDFFNHGLYREPLLAPQYGLEVEKGQYSLLGVVKDRPEKRLQLKTRIKKLTPAKDITGLFEHGSSGNKYELSLSQYINNTVITGGLSNIYQEYFSLLRNKWKVELEKLQFMGSAEMLFPLIFKERDDENNRKKGPEYQLTGGIEYLLSPEWSLNSRLSISDTEYIVDPVLYRGSEKIFENGKKTEASLELRYGYKYKHSLEILQFIQVTGMEGYCFVDFYKQPERIEEAVAAGIGLNLKVNILGVKPVSFGGYISRDFNDDSTRTGLCLDINF